MMARAGSECTAMPADRAPLSSACLSQLSDEIRGQAEAYAKARAAGGIDDATFDVAAARAALAQTERPHALDLPHRKDEVGGVPVVRIGADDGTRPLLIYIHGGGFVGGTFGSHGPIANALAKATGWPALFIDYRLAPEHPFPAAFDDCAAVIGALERDRPVALAGDSVGGALVLWAAHVAADGNGPPVFAIGLMAAMLDFDPSTSDYLRRSGRARSMIGNAVREHDLGDQRLRLPWGDPKGVPPAIVQTGGADYVADDGIRFAANLARAGHAVVWEHWPHMPHVFQRYVPDAPEANHAVTRVAAFFKTHTP